MTAPLLAPDSPRDQAPPPAPARRPRRTLGIAALACAVLALATAPVPFDGSVLVLLVLPLLLVAVASALTAVALGIAALVVRERRAAPVAALVLGAIAVVVAIGAAGHALDMLRGGVRTAQAGAAERAVEDRAAANGTTDRVARSPIGAVGNGRTYELRFASSTATATIATRAGSPDISITTTERTPYSGGGDVRRTADGRVRLEIAGRPVEADPTTVSTCSIRVDGRVVATSTATGDAVVDCRADG